MDKKIELNINNRKKYQRKSKLPKKIDVDEKLVYKFAYIQNYMLVVILKPIFDVVMET